MGLNLIITLNTSKDFVEELDTILHQELKDSSRKWGITLSDEHRSLVLLKSFEQLINKVQFISGNEWQLGSPITFTIGDDEKEFTLPMKNTPEIFLNRTIDKWVIAQDINEESVLLSDFYTVALDEIRGWAKTAMFYGVASFKEQ